LIEGTPANYHGHFIRFQVGKPESEIVLRGLCQLLIESFREFHSTVRVPLGLPEFGKELELNLFQDGSFSLRAWEHLVYLHCNDEIEERLILAQGRSSKKYHAEYLGSGLKAKMELQKRVEFLNQLLADNQTQPNSHP